MSRNRARGRSSRASASWALALPALAACQPSGGTAAPSPPPAASAQATAPSGRPRPEAAPSSPVRLSSGVLRELRESPELRLIEDGVRLSRSEFSSARLQAATSRARQASVAGSLELVLDDQSPRPLLEASVLLSSIVDEDRELSAGWHVLVAFIATPAQIEFHRAHFELELGHERTGQEAACALVAPRGTLHRASASPVELVAVPLRPAVTRFEYFVGSDPSATLRARGLESASAAGLASGDHRVGVRCYDDGGTLVGQSERTVTINDDDGVRRPSP